MNKLCKPITYGGGVAGEQSGEPYIQMSVLRIFFLSVKWQFQDAKQKRQRRGSINYRREKLLFFFQKNLGQNPTVRDDKSRCPQRSRVWGGAAAQEGM